MNCSCLNSDLCIIAVYVTFTNFNTNAHDQKKVLLKNPYPAVLRHEFSVWYPRHIFHVVQCISLRGVLIFVNEIYVLT